MDKVYIVPPMKFKKNQELVIKVVSKNKWRVLRSSDALENIFGLVNMAVLSRGVVFLCFRLFLT